MLPHIDRWGNKVKPGDYVVYGRNLGRCATTAIGRVVEVKEKINRWSDEPNGVKIVIDSVQDDQGYAKDYGDGLRIKRITIQEADRVILYDKKLVGKDVLAAFKAWDKEQANG